MDLNKKIKFNDSYIKIDPPMWTDADFECADIPTGAPQKKLFLNKPISVD